MEVLQVLYKGKKDKDWQVMAEDRKALDTAVMIRMQLRVNGFGRLRTTNPMLYNMVKTAVNNGYRIPTDLPEFKPDGWVCFCELESELSGNRTAYVKAVLEIRAKFNNLKSSAISSFLMDGYRNGKADVFPFDHNNGTCAGIDYTGVDFKHPGVGGVYTLCTMDGCHLHGNLSQVTFRQCHMQDVSFKDALVYDNGNGCCYSTQNCFMYGAKYFANIGGHGQLQPDLMYDIAATEGDSSVTANDALFLKAKPPMFRGGRDGGFNIETSTKPCLVSELEDFKFEAPAYVPKPGKVLAQHIKDCIAPGVEVGNPRGQVWYNGRLMDSKKLVKCALTGWMADEDCLVRECVEEEAFAAITGRAGAFSDRSCGLGYKELRCLPLFQDGGSYTVQCRASNLRIMRTSATSHGHSWYHRTLVPRERLAQYRAVHGELTFHTAEHEDENLHLKEGNPFFGFELEVEMQQDSKKVAKLNVSDTQKALILAKNQAAFDPVLDVVKKDGFFLTKSDGSLQFGYEIVSQPFSWGWWNQHRDSRIKNLLETLQAGGYVSHDGGRCGLHVHMSRKAFKTVELKSKTGGKFRGSLHLMRFSRMVYLHPEFSIWMSRRHDKNPRYAMIEPKKFNNGTMKTIAQHGQSVCDRYSAINYCNEHTVEVRMFRGTLNFKSFCGSLELCHALWAYTATPTNPLDIRAFIKWVNTSYLFDAKGERQTIYPYLSGLFKSKAEPGPKGQKSELELVLSKEWKFAEEGWEKKLPAKALKMGLVQEASA